MVCRDQISPDFLSVPILTHFLRKVGTIMAIVKVKDGYRFRVGYHDALGNYKRKFSKVYEKRRDALEAERKFKANPLSNQKLDTFGEIFEAWILEGKEHGEKSSTSLDKRRMISIYFSELFRLPINSITPTRIKTLLVGERWQNLCTSRKNRGLTWLSAIFKYAQTYHGLAVNPVTSIPRYKKTEAEKMKEQNVYTVQEFNKFIECIPDKFRVYAHFFTLLFYTGARLNEIRSLTFDHVHGSIIRIDRQLDRLGIQGFTSVKTKSGRRNIALPSNCHAIIENQRKLYSAMPGFSGDWFVFGGYKPLSDRTIERVKQDTVRNNNLKPIRIHDFRHSHASILIEAGVNMYKISKRLGHSSITITMDRYGHLLDTEEAEILNAIETS